MIQRRENHAAFSQRNFTWTSFIIRFISSPRPLLTLPSSFLLQWTGLELVLVASGNSLADQRVALRSAGNPGLPCAPIALKVISFTANKTRNDSSSKSSASLDQLGFARDFLLIEKKQPRWQRLQLKVKQSYIQERSISRKHVAWLLQNCS